MLKIETSTAITDPEDWASQEWQNSPFVYRQAVFLREAHPWHDREVGEAYMHPSVTLALRSYKPTDWRQVVFEWPHLSDDNNQIAYTRNAEKGAADVQTLTSPGKYIKRHWPDLKDDVIRDMVYMARDKSGCSVIKDNKEMCDAIDNGPFSCMQNKEVNGYHPYEVYCPSLGWSLAVRRNEDGRIVARALLLDQGEFKHYVRSYSSGGNDDELDAYMTDLGYSYQGSWPFGTRLAAIEGRRCEGDEDEWVFPYIDGNHDQVEHDGDHLVISMDGPWTCSNQDGTASFEDDDRQVCEDCGEATDDEEICCVGEDSDYQVCESCCNRRYTFAIGYGGNEYYVRDNVVTVVGDRTYHDNYLEDNDLVELDSGDWVHQDDAVYCEESEAYFAQNDRNLVTLANGVVCHMDHAWQCDVSGNWYVGSDDKVEIDGAVYHRDYATSQDAWTILPPLGGYDKSDGDIPNEAQIGLTFVSMDLPSSPGLFVGPPRYERFCVEPSPPHPDGTYWHAGHLAWKFEPKPDGDHDWKWDSLSYYWFCTEEAAA